MFYFLVWLSGYVAAYLLSRFFYWVSGDEWTVGERAKMLKVCLFSWGTFAVAIIIYLVMLCNTNPKNPDEKAKW